MPLPDLLPRAMARLLTAVRATLGDRRRGLGRGSYQHLFFVVGEQLAIGLLGEEEVDVGAAVAHRARAGRSARGPRGRNAERAGVSREVGNPQRPQQVAQVLQRRARYRSSSSVALMRRIAQDLVSSRPGLPESVKRLLPR